MSVYPKSYLAASGRSSRCGRCRAGVAGIVLAGILCLELTAPSPCQSGGRIGPSGAAVAGTAVGVGAAIAIVTVVLLNHAHHTITGCAFNGPSGMKLKASDSKIYAIDADTSSIKAGDKVKVHGSRGKKTKDADQMFNVDRVSKDYGPCHADLAQSSSSIP